VRRPRLKGKETVKVGSAGVASDRGAEAQKLGEPAAMVTVPGVGA